MKKELFLQKIADIKGVANVKIYRGEYVVDLEKGYVFDFNNNNTISSRAQKDLEEKVANIVMRTEDEIKLVNSIERLKSDIGWKSEKISREEAYIRGSEEAISSWNKKIKEHRCYIEYYLKYIANENLLIEHRKTEVEVAQKDMAGLNEELNKLTGGSNESI